MVNTGQSAQKNAVFLSLNLTFKKIQKPSKTKSIHPKLMLVKVAKIESQRNQ